MNFDTYLFIEHAQNRINGFRRSANLWIATGNITALFVFSMMATVCVQMALRGLYSIGTAGAQHQAVAAWNFFDQNVHLLWIFVLSLPLPKTLPRANESMLVYGIPLAFYLGALLVCAVLKHRGQKLRKIADKAQELLDLQAPLLKQLDVQGQIIDVGGIHGNNNTINATNRVSRVMKEAEKESHWWKITIAIAIPVLTWILNHYLHLT